MSKLLCPCGHTLSNSACPSTNIGWLLNDYEAESGELDPIEHGIEVWECHDCGRLAFGSRDDNLVKWYSPENGKPGQLTNYMKDFEEGGV